VATKSNLPNPSAAVAADESDPQVPATPVPTVTVTFYQQLASDFMKELDDIAPIIPRIEVTRTYSADFVRSFRNIPIPFLVTAVMSVEQTPDLQGVNKLDVKAGKDTLQFLEAFRPVLDKLTAIQQSLKFTMDHRKASLAAPALQIYDVAKGLGRDQSDALLASAVANMKRDLKRGRPRNSAALRKAAAAKGVTPEGGKLAA
jgi:hypothetical protein